MPREAPGGEAMRVARRVAEGAGDRRRAVAPGQQKPAVRQRGQRPRVDLGFGRIVVSAIEVTNVLVNLV